MATDTVIKVAIDILKDSIKSYIASQYDYQFGVKSSLGKLDSNLTTIQAAMAIAMRNGNEEQHFVRWLNEIKDAICEAEDIVDTFQYQRLEQEAKRSPVLSNNQMPGCLRFVPCEFTDLLKVGIKFLKRMVYKDEDLNELTRIVAEIDRIVTQIPNLLHIAEGHFNIRPILVGNNDEVQEGRRKTSKPDELNLYGRDTEKGRLLKLLKENLEEGDVCYNTLCIVGIGGVGKTTLAQFVYNDASLKEYFGVKAWVSVSYNFTMERLMMEIMQSASIHMPPNIREQGFINVENCLAKGLDGKRFLIVLDDVWETMELDKWESLCKLFRTSEKGSKILVTTRTQEVGRRVGEKETMPLLPLQSESFKELFLKCSFGMVDPKDHQSLENIALQIAEKLDGLPLAAKTIGAVLKYDMKESHWENILRSKAWAEKENRVMATLKLSYDHLPSYLKQCFISCSVFPRNTELHLMDLASYWVANDFIQERNTQKQLLEVVREYVDELVARSFFSFTKRGYYVMHTLVHDLATSLSRDEIYRVEDDDSMNSIPNTIRHLFVGHGSLEMVLEKIPPKRLRSLFYWDSEGKFILPTTSIKLKSLRMLYISNDYNEIDFKVVGRLKHLRSLIIEGQLRTSGPTEYSETICKLYQLKTLIIPNVQLKGLHKLFNLHTVIVGDVGKSRLYQLLLPKEFGSYVAIEDDGCRMSDFRNLNKLFGDLHLQIKSNVRIDEAREAKLVDKKHIKKLCFKIYGSDQLQEDVFEELRPNQHLQELQIVCPREGDFKATKLPSWISKAHLCNLKHMVLVGCKYLETLPSLGELPHLQVLLLERLHSLKNIGNEFYGEGDILFPSLKMILVRGLENLEKWSAPSNKKEMFPNLLEVYIAECHKLQGPIPFPTPPKPFDIVITEKEEEEDEEDEKKKEEEDRKEEGKEKDEEEDEKGEEDEEEKEDEKGEKAKELLQQIEEDDYPWESRLLFKVEDISLIISPHSENYPDAQYVEELVWINKSCSHGLFLSSLSSLKELYLHFSNIQSMPLQSLPTSLKKLALLCCAKLEDVDGLKDLTSLEELVIHFCPNIKKLPEPCLPASIKLLEVINYDPDFATWPNGIYTRIYTPEWYKSFEVRYRVYNGGWYKPTLHPRWWRKGKWEEKLDWRKNDPESEWHKISHIPCIFINTEDIPYPPLDDGLT